MARTLRASRAEQSAAPLFDMLNALPDPQPAPPTEHTRRKPPPLAVSNDEAVVIGTAVKQWNDFAADHQLARVVKLTPKRQRGVAARLREPEFDLSKILHLVAHSRFLCGRNRSGWRVHFDFIFCSPHNYIKILEGNYNNDLHAPLAPEPGQFDGVSL